MNSRATDHDDGADTPASSGRGRFSIAVETAFVTGPARIEHAVEPAEEALCVRTWPDGGSGFRIVAHSAGVRISATSTDRPMADTSVIENCR